MTRADSSQYTVKRSKEFENIVDQDQAQAGRDAKCFSNMKTTELESP